MIDALGLRVDADLRSLDIRLTQGGEPTYVSARDTEAPEWNTTAIGDTKHHLAEKLRRRLASRFARGGLLHDGQGRWYPGEALPRWSLDIFWRKDGVALWASDTLTAEAGRDYGYGLDQARALMEAVVGETNVGSEYVVPAYEDPWPLLYDVNRLPVDVDPLKHDLRDPAARARLTRLVEGNVASPAGLVLPLRPGEPGEARWISGRWPLVRDRLYLLPGTSPQGYRLPLDTLPISETDPIVRSAFCVEVRRGALFVFMPPFENLEDYFALLEIIERGAARSKLAVRIEGYDPPVDPCLFVLRLTPDPGVLEVNLHPAASWAELRANMEGLDEDARDLGLTTVKHWFNGRLLATGGGSHVTLGGPSLAESPFVRRPDLLRSLLTYWQHHPALSYLFSGLFVGPTSQAPRIDEARDDLLYALELAFQELDAVASRVDAAPKPRELDGILGRLLVDVTGNAHRAEFCIDKLFPPDSPDRQLGVLELRAFEMPPDWRTGMLQSLLVRALIARFWKTPYRGKFRSWQGALHDRFMLPYFLNADLQQVLEELKADGYGFAPEWFLPFLEFRFPRIGQLRFGDIELELRHALEPWLALGDQAASGASSRPVDSSVERIQLLMRGPGVSGFWVMCNGRRVPLQPASEPDKAVCGVRFRAWNLSEMLHPTIRAQAPLTFEIVDRRRGVVVASCRYHVGRPDGKDYERRPPDPTDAEKRRAERFEVLGAQPERVALDTKPPRKGSPFTLDLRRGYE